ncbi:monocarboxylate transporter 13-like [Saccoglossus kowalevskii]
MATEQRTATRCMMGSTRGDTEYQRQVPTELTELGMGVDEKRTQWHNRGTRTRWLVCLAGFVLQVPFMGMVMSFGEMLLPLLDTFGGGTVGISWVGSISFGMAYMGNPLSSKLTDMIGARKVATCGVLLGSLGLLLTSFVQSLWLMFITYSIMFGLATNFTYSPPLILTGYWFPDKYHVMATGLQVAGIPFGSLVMNPICQTLLQATGLRTTYRILSALVLILGLACCFMLSSPLPTSERHEFEEGTESGAEIHDRMHAGYHHWIDDMIKRQPDDDSEVSCCGHLTRHRCYLQENLWTDTVFILFMLGQFVKGMGYVFPFIHLINFMHSMGIDPASGAFILTAKGAADMVGRVVAACLGDKLPFDLIHVYVAACGVMALTTYACTFVTDLGGMFFYAICEFSQLFLKFNFNFGLFHNLSRQRN